MEDGEKPTGNSHGISDMDVVDAAVHGQRVSSSPTDNSPAQQQQDQVMVEQGDDNKNGDSDPSNVPETSVISENQFEVEDSKTVSHHELITPKPKEKNIREMKNVLNDTEMTEYDEYGTPLDRETFMKELENFYRERSLEFKPPKFYGEPLNCLKLWRAVIRLGGYDVVTGSKLWRQVGESFNPPKTCTTVSWTFRIFYEKALLEYEKHKRETGELQLPVGSFHQSPNVEKETTVYQAPGSGRARRDAAARAMQGWHAQRLLGYGEVAEPATKDKSFSSTPKREKNLKSIGMINKQRTPAGLEHAEKAANIEGDRQLVTPVVDIGPPADWVKINVRETKDCFEVYALVPGLLREEVRVQSDPVGRLVITGTPEHIDNPWGITPFKKVVNLPARIDPLQTSAVVSLHGRLFVRVPFEQGAV
ncbi:AT-rich interactive domain-containing protein 5 [Vigna unguiculata]|uniref:AT-rich interactive domain-containing protein 5 n=1 Tax=Vigna unguiculata TaxID=3917 RepID=UPI001015D472|nr:AT-rich interactive domain-containing protein 5 [Vigna unguiculata]XP_027905385.1 AT-rich interactive domain-containing protein 5 [Vigna unguiculata]XP_027905386.1 AT-rich interactive domain-containing protein 5 [Vigna unguiculata]XP_027905387.1 AT-rich interactive domain-containing protein 5 [Vigna unguiculata]XP_027905388.1 AT-rich interactive domain-containing protein 5 [Vigna unguiculata]